MKYEPTRVIVNRLFGAILDAEHRIVDFSLRELYAFGINNVDKLLRLQLWTVRIEPNFL